MPVMTELPVQEANLLEAYAARTLVVPVRRYGREPRWDVTDDKAQLLRRVVTRACDAVEKADMALSLWEELLKVDIEPGRDLWYTQMPDGSLVVLAHQHLCDSMAEREIAHRVHADVIEVAHSRGEDVSPHLLRWSRSLLGAGTTADTNRPGA